MMDNDQEENISENDNLEQQLNRIQIEHQQTKDNYETLLHECHLLIEEQKHRRIEK